VTNILRSDRQPSRYIEDFRGDFAEVASLMQRSWAENKEQPLLYTADFLASCFEYPGTSFYLAPSIYDGSLPVAFVAGFPRLVRLKGRELRIVVITFLTVSPRCKKKGYGVILWSELVKRAKSAGFDGMINYCVDGDAMNGMIRGCCHRLKLPIEHVYSVGYIARVLHAKGSVEAEKEVDAGNVADFLRISAQIGERTRLTRIWSEEEAKWQCVRRLGSIFASYAAGRRKGILTSYVMQLADRDRNKCLLMEDLLWGNLERQERGTLLRQLLDKAVAAGVRVVTVPLLGYADTEPFAAAHFVHSRRVVHVYLTVWTNQPAGETFPSIYLDVF
jgi:GNAT superfamily N-acetyltransferase